MTRLTPILAALALLGPGVAAAERAAEAYRGATPRRSGWRSFGGDEPLMGQHWTPPDAPDYVSGQPIDPARPSNVMITDIAGQPTLVALSYNVRIGPGEPVPDGFAGQSDDWHVHDMEQFLRAAGQTRPVLGWLGQRWLEREAQASDGKTRLAMVHVWMIPNPEGRFANHNPTLAYLDLGLPAGWADGMEAARGVALAGPDGCDRALDGKLWVAGADRRTRRALGSVCADLADWVRAAIPMGKAELNRRGRSAFSRLSFEMTARLTAAEKARIGAMVEGGSSHLLGQCDS